MSTIMTEASSLLESVNCVGFPVSWVGDGPAEGIVCFGSEDGGLRYGSLDGVVLPGISAEDGEAVNSVAFVDEWIARSTRSKILLLPSTAELARTNRVGEVPYGAHQVVATQNGGFLAALGSAGFTTCQRDRDAGWKVNIGSVASERVYFYRLATIPSASGEFVAAALRRGGVGWMEIDDFGLSRKLLVQSFSGLDVVDVCTADFAGSTGLVALGRDGTLILWKHRGADPVTVRFDAIKGTGYRVLRAGTQLFVLTSHALYVLQDLVDAVAAGGSQDLTASVLELPMEAVDASVIGDRWVYVVLPDAVQRLDASLLHLLPTGDHADFRLVEMHPNRLTPQWIKTEVGLDVHQAA